MAKFSNAKLQLLLHQPSSKRKVVSQNTNPGSFTLRRVEQAVVTGDDSGKCCITKTKGVQF